MMPFYKYKSPVGLFVLAVGLLFLKSPDALLAPQFWAEDGPVFFASQFQRDWPPFLTSYAGYLHTVTRLVAWVASCFKPEHAPLVYNTLAILIDALCIAFVSIRMASWFSKWAVCVSFFLVPTAGDIFGTATNVQWFMQFALAAACFAPVTSSPVPRILRIAGYIALALAGLSGPFSVLISVLIITTMMLRSQPFVVVGRTSSTSLTNIVHAVARAGSRLCKANICIIIGCACIQIVVLITNEVRTPVEQFLLNSQQQLSLGIPPLVSFYSYTVNHPFIPANLALATLMGASVLGCFAVASRQPSTANGIGCLLAMLGTAQPVLAYMKQRELHTLAATSHYFYFLGVVSCWIAWRWLSTVRPHTRKSALVIVATTFIIGVTLRPDYFRREPLHDLRWSQYANRMYSDRHQSLIVPVNPLPWHFKVP